VENEKSRAERPIGPLARLFSRNRSNWDNSEN
jgi:hypothetical protein